MANTFTQVYVQIVFAVEWRQSLIRPEHKEEIHKYTGIVRNKEQKLIEINTMPDHLHMLVGLRPDMAISDLAREVKKASTIFINQRGFIRVGSIGREGSVRFHTHTVTLMPSSVTYVTRIVIIALLHSRRNT